MSQYHYKFSAAEVLKPRKHLTVYDYKMTLAQKLDCAVVEIDGTHGPVCLHDIEEILFILEGELFISQSGEEFHVQKGDMFHLKAGEWRTLKGKAKALAICNPPYDPSKEDYKGA